MFQKSSQAVCCRKFKFCTVNQRAAYFMEPTDRRSVYHYCCCRLRVTPTAPRLGYHSRLDGRPVGFTPDERETQHTMWTTQSNRTINMSVLCRRWWQSVGTWTGHSMTSRHITTARPSASSRGPHDKTSRDKAEQGRTGQDKTRQGKARQDETRRDETRQEKTRQDKTRRPDKTR